MHQYIMIVKATYDKLIEKQEVDYIIWHVLKILN